MKVRLSCFAGSYSTLFLHACSCQRIPRITPFIVEEITFAIHAKRKLRPLIRKLRKRQCTWEGRHFPAHTVLHLCFAGYSWWPDEVSIPFKVLVRIMLKSSPSGLEMVMALAKHMILLAGSNLSNTLGLSKEYAHALLRIHSILRYLLQRSSMRILNGQFSCGSLSGRKGGRDLVIAEKSCNFLSHICHAVRYPDGR